MNDDDIAKPLYVGGPKGETLFFAPRSFLLKESNEYLQQDYDEYWKHYKGIRDHKLLVLVAALCIENQLTNLLLSYSPGICEYKNDSEITFSIKVKFAKSMRIIPSRILSSCDLIRQIRNVFAHNLEIRTFANLDSKYLNKLHPYIMEYNKDERDPSDYIKLFIELTGFTLTALIIYTKHLLYLREYLLTNESTESFELWFKNKNK
jgi:hypothetical protein